MKKIYIRPLCILTGFQEDVVCASPNLYESEQPDFVFSTDPWEVNL